MCRLMIRHSKTYQSFNDREG